MSKITNFERLAGLSALAAGVTGFAYSVAVVVVSRTNPTFGDFLSNWFLLLGGLLALPVLVVLYERLRIVNASLATLGLILSVAGAIGAIIHGGYGLSSAFSPSVEVLSQTGLPNQVDPSGLLTFGLAGLGWFVWSALLGAARHYKAEFSQLGYLLGSLLLIVYVATLIGLPLTHPVLLIPAIMSGFFVYPAWYIWVGSTLRHQL